MSTHITHNADKQRYEIHVDGELAGFTETKVDGDVVTLPHTKVFEQFGGQGIAGQLVSGALDDVRERQQKIVPECEYVAGYIEKHPEYADLVA